MLKRAFLRSPASSYAFPYAFHFPEFCFCRAIAFPGLNPPVPAAACFPGFIHRKNPGRRETAEEDEEAAAEPGSGR